MCVQGSRGRVWSSCADLGCPSTTCPTECVQACGSGSCCRVINELRYQFKATPIWQPPFCRLEVWISSTAFSAQRLTGLKSRGCRTRLSSGGLREGLASELVQLLPAAAGGKPSPLAPAARAVGGHLHFFSRGSRGPPQSEIGHWVLSLLPYLFAFCPSQRKRSALKGSPA